LNKSNITSAKQFNTAKKYAVKTDDLRASNDEREIGDTSF